MKYLLTILFLTAAITCFAGVNPVLQNPFTTNNQANADAHVIALSATNISFATPAQTAAGTSTTLAVNPYDLSQTILSTNDFITMLNALYAPIGSTGSTNSSGIIFTNIQFQFTNRLDGGGSPVHYTNHWASYIQIQGLVATLTGNDYNYAGIVTYGVTGRWSKTNSVQAAAITGGTIDIDTIPTFGVYTNEDFWFGSPNGAYGVIQYAGEIQWVIGGVGGATGPQGPPGTNDPAFVQAQIAASTAIAPNLTVGSAATANTLTTLTRNTVSPPSTTPSSPYSLIVCWGDSLTAGYCSAGPVPSYANYLSSLLNIPVNIQGFSGASSSTILSNFLAAPNLWGYPTIIWSGRNDFPGTNTVLGNIATMVSDLNSVGNSNYLVMSIINMEDEYSGTTNPTSGYYFTITNLNHYLSATYPNNFFDVREYLVNAANTNLPQDLWTFTNDIPADSLRCSPSDVHLNSAGYFTVANGILQTSFLNQNKNVVSEGKTRSLISETLANPPAIGLITPNSINATSINATSINATNINASTAITVGGIYNSTLSPGELVLSASTNVVIVQSMQRGVSGNGYPVDSWYISAIYGLYLNRYYTTGNMSWGFGITNNAIGYPNTLWMYGTGFVGIGTNAPSQQLEVNGSALIDGAITATNFVGNGSGLTNIPSKASWSILTNNLVTGVQYSNSLSQRAVVEGRYVATMSSAGFGGYYFVSISGGRDGAMQTNAYQFKGATGYVDRISVSRHINAGEVFEFLDNSADGSGYLTNCDVIY